MSHAAKFIVGWLLIFHFVVLFFVMQNPAKKTEARAFFTSVLSRGEWISYPASPVPVKPRIPFRILSPFASDLYRSGQYVQLQANKPAKWFVDHGFVGEDRSLFWIASPGAHFIEAFYDEEESRMVMIAVN
ncbi:MAG: hypothetical protein V1760_02940 [Candidatus Peregrinibacteria bacterium]